MKPISIKSRDFVIKECETQKEINDTFKVRYEVYCNELKYLKKEDYPDKLESDKYDKHSIHFIIYFKEKPIGCVRIVKDSEVGLPLETNFTIKKYRSEFSDMMIEASRFIILKDYRNKLLSSAMFKAIYSYMLIHKIKHLFAVSKKKDLDYYKAAGLEQIGESREYDLLGGKWTPLYGNTDTYKNKLGEEITNQDFLKYVLNTKGIVN